MLRSLVGSEMCIRDRIKGLRAEHRSLHPWPKVPNLIDTQGQAAGPGKLGGLGTLATTRIGHGQAAGLGTLG